MTATVCTLSLTDHGRAPTVALQAQDETGQTRETLICGEHPLTLYLDKRELVTLMTLGTHPEDLALGWLRNQRIVTDIKTLAAVQVDWDTESVAITSRNLAEHGRTLWTGQAAEALDARLGQRTVTTGCGQGTVYGDLMSSLGDVQWGHSIPLTRDAVYSVIDQVRGHDTLYKQAGAVHACALFSQVQAGMPRLLRFVEDVGRHNAVDAIAGWMWREGLSGDNLIFYTTGRLTSEMVIKCAQMGIPVLMSRSGLTGMGHALAEQLGLTMFARCQGRHYLLYTGAHRLLDTQPAQA